MTALSIGVSIRIPPHISKARVDDKFLLIDVLEGEPEDHSKHGTRNGRASKRPCKIRILDGRGGGKTNGSGDGGHEEVDGRYETLHVLGRARVGDCVGGDVDEDLGDGAQNDGDGVERNGHGREGWCAL